MKKPKKKIDLKTHLKRMINKAYIMGWTIKQVHEAIDRIVSEHIGEVKEKGKED